MVSHFGVYSRKRGRVWTETPGFHAKPDQVLAIVEGFVDDLQLRVQGIKLQDQQFVLTRMSVNHVMMLGRASTTGRGCVVYLCRTCVVIATYDDGQLAGNCYYAIEKLGDFLVEENF